MKTSIFFVSLLAFCLLGCSSSNSPINKTVAQTNSIATITDSMKYNPLTPQEEYVILNKGTERPFTGKYTNSKDKGTYICRRCNAPLYRSDDKFDSHCGWPSFDDEIKGAVRKFPDPDGQRTEIVCNNCGGHLGHVFYGEGFTAKNTRHCVNSISMSFVPADNTVKNTDTNTTSNTQRAIFASGCFWGTEYYLKRTKGVISTQCGYIGGKVKNPSYKEVCYNNTGHAEAVEVVFDSTKVTYEELCKYFFETHDPTQINRQGPDIGDQYRSEIFYTNDSQKQVAEKLIKILTDKGYKIATKVTQASEFYSAEDYHQDYYDSKGGTPYCHKYTKRF